MTYTRPDGLDYPLHGWLRSIRANAISKEPLTEPNWLIKQQERQAREQQQREEELQHRLRHENNVIFKIVQFGNELPYLPTLEQLYRSGRFSQDDLELKTVCDALTWLTCGPISSRCKKSLIVDGSNSSLCRIIQQDSDKFD